jgi:hypothetical protein
MAERLQNSPATRTPSAVRLRRPLRLALFSALLCALLLVPLPSEAKGQRREAPTIRPVQPGEGVVAFVSTRRAYLNLGQRDGLTTGAFIELTRGGAPAGKCRVEATTDHFASCAGDGLLKGDSFHVTPPSLPPSPPLKARAGQPPEEAGELARLQSLMTSSSFDPVPFRGSRDEVPGGRSLSAGFTHSTWALDGLTSFQQERLDLAIRGVELASGVRANVAATVLAWPLRPANTPFFAGHPIQLFVRELSLSARDPGRPYAAAIGRLWPWHLPGITALDGAQAAWRGPNGLELGAYGGAVPDPVTIGPGFSRWTAGGYWVVDAGEAGGILRFLRHEGRAGVVMTPEGGLRAEADVVAQAAFGHLVDLNIDLRGSANEKGASLDGSQLSLVARPSEGWRVWGDFRSVGVNAALPLGPLVGASPSLRADMGGSWHPSGDLGVGASAGYVDDFSEGVRRFFVGPEVDLPRVLGPTGGLSFGYSEELGHLPGRTGWVQSVWSPHPRVRVLGRLSYLEEGLGPGSTTRDLTAWVSVDGNLWRFLSARLTVLGRANVATDVPDRALLGTASVEAHF